MKELGQHEAAWVERTLAELSVAEKIGQLFYPLLTPDTLEAEGFERSDMEGFCREFQIGGGHLFGGELDQVRRTTGQIQAGCRVPALISGDLDRGGGNRIRGGVLFQYQMALGAADSEELAYALGRNIALENRLAGYNWAFGPVVDLCAHRDGPKPVASMGDCPEQVARLACAQIRGIQDHGMAACAKHFPGDGYDDRDIHLVTTVNPLGEEEWWKKSGLPFQKSIEAGVFSIMTAGIALPSIDPHCSEDGIPLPAIFSKKLLIEVLREKMGFEGVLVTDALNMGGVSCHSPLIARYLRAFEAGNDALLFVRRLEESRQAFLRACAEGIITPGRLDASVRRILGMKARLHLPAELREKSVPLPAPLLGAEEFRNSAKHLAEASVTLLKDRNRGFPPALPTGTRVAHILITNRGDQIDLEPFNREFGKAGHTVATFINPDPEPMYDRVEAGEFGLLVHSFYYPTQWGWGTSRCHGPHIRSIMSGFHKARRDVPSVFLSLCGPFHLYEMPFMDPFLVTYGDSPAALKAAARMVLGILPTRGRIPVGMEGFFRRGDGVFSAAFLDRPRLRDAGAGSRL